MNDKKSQYWKWKSTIIDFDNLSNEKNEYGGYITKKDLIFQQLGTPDKEIHEWYNGKYSSEYNEAYRYAYELNLIEHYRDYEDEIYQLQFNWNSLRECIDYQLKHNVGGSAESSIRNHVYQEIKDKMNELEGKDKK